MKIEPFRREGYELLQAGVEELARVEGNGIRIDMPRLQETKDTLSRKIRELKSDLASDEVWKIWRKRFGEKSNLASHDQLSQILHDELGYKVTDTTERGKPSTDEEALQKIDNPFVAKLVRMLKYSKALGTFLAGIEKEVVDGRLHPVFNLHTVQTYRSSSDSPNFQNLPVRDKEMSKIIRSLFIPSSGCALAENDFKGIEVGVSACYHKDPNFISYITTPGKDMHRDMAAQIYMLKPEEVSKDARYGAKNKFVFPQFYGDFYVACARNLWDWIIKGKLTGPNGIPLLEHLRAHGIKTLGKCDPEQDPRSGTFEAHLKEVEDDFWNSRFQAYGKWRRDFYRAYLAKGYFDLHTGFRISGSFKRNQVTNFPVQGSGFHCLLWTLIQVNRKLRKHRMKAMIVGQIHDSLIGDVPVRELRDYLEIVEEAATVKLRKHYADWLIVPLEIEYEITPSNGTWFDKVPIVFSEGKFKHLTKDMWTSDANKLIKLLNRGLKR